MMTPAEAVAKAVTAARDTGYRPLRAGHEAWTLIYQGLREHEKLTDKWQRFSPSSAAVPTIMVANTPVELDVMLAPEAIEPLK